MSKRPRIAEDFFDETFTEATPTPPKPKVEVKAEPQAQKKPAKQSKPKAMEASTKDLKVRTTLYIKEELHEKARWAILNLDKAPRSISQLMESALERELSRLAKVSGTEIGRHTVGLPGGRPRATA